MPRRHHLIRTLKAAHPVGECYAFSPCGRLLANSSPGGWLLINQYETAQLIADIRSTTALLVLAWNPFAKHEVLCGYADGRIVVYRLNVENPSIEHVVISAHDCAVSHLAIGGQDHPMVVSCGPQECMKIWKLLDDRLVRSAVPFPHEIRKLSGSDIIAFEFVTHTTNLIVLSDSRQIWSWDTVIGKLNWTITFETFVPFKFALTPDRDYLVVFQRAVRGSVVNAYNLANRSHATTLCLSDSKSHISVFSLGHTSPSRCGVMYENYDGRLRLIDLWTHTEVESFEERVKAVATFFDPDSNVSLIATFHSCDEGEGLRRRSFQGKERVHCIKIRKLDSLLANSYSTHIPQTRRSTSTISERKIAKKKEYSAAEIPHHGHMVSETDLDYVFAEYTEKSLFWENEWVHLLALSILLGIIGFIVSLYLRNARCRTQVHHVALLAFRWGLILVGSVLKVSFWLLGHSQIWRTGTLPAIQDTLCPHPMYKNP